ncbi:MAG: ribonuclease P protein component [Bacteroidota bacterium]
MDIKALAPLKGYKAFNNAFSRGKKFHHDKAVAVVIYDHSSAGSENTVKFGVTVAKRRAKKAVTRNRIKKLLRESIKLKLAETDIRHIDTLIIAWKDAPKAPSRICLSDVSPVVDFLIDKAVTYYKKFLEEG